MERRPLKTQTGAAHDWANSGASHATTLADLASCLSLAPCLFALSGCSHQASVASEAKVARIDRGDIASPVQRTIHYVVEEPGRVEPFEQTPIYAKIPGYVRTVSVDIGDRVKRGDLLVELNVPEVVEAHHAKEALVTQARLGVTQAERSVDVIQASLATAEANLEVTKAAREKTPAAFKRWESECQRMEQLTRDKVVDAQSRDEVRNQCRSAEAADKEAAARIHGAEAALVEARARLAKAKADFAAARNQLLVSQAEERESLAHLGYSRLVAPFDGVIADRQVHTGHFLNAANGSTTGQPLLVVVRTDKVRVFAEVPEADAVRVAGRRSRPHSGPDAQRSRVRGNSHRHLVVSRPEPADLANRDRLSKPGRIPPPGNVLSLIDRCRACQCVGDPGQRRPRAGRDDVLLRSPRRQNAPPASSPRPSRRQSGRNPEDPSPPQSAGRSRPVGQSNGPGDDRHYQARRAR